jgi:hypothetical protein
LSAQASLPVFEIGIPHGAFNVAAPPNRACSQKERAEMESAACLFPNLPINCSMKSA